MNRVVVYTPVEDFWYNSDIGPIFFSWFVSLILAMFIVIAMSSTSRREWKLWQLIGAAACLTYTIHYIMIWLLVHI